MATDTDTNTQDSTAAAQNTPDTVEVMFKVGWNIETFCRKNGYSLDEKAHLLWLKLSREASAAQLARMASNQKAGCKTTVRQSAVWSQAKKRWDTAETARVVSPGCEDVELIQAAYVKAQARQAKTLATMKAAAINQGATIE